MPIKYVPVKEVEESLIRAHNMLRSALCSARNMAVASEHWIADAQETLKKDGLKFAETDKGGFTYDSYIGKDVIPVVHVQTEGMPEDANGPLCRIYLNDEVIFENPPHEGDTSD